MRLSAAWWAWAGVVFYGLGRPSYIRNGPNGLAWPTSADMAFVLIHTRSSRLLPSLGQPQPPTVAPARMALHAVSPAAVSSPLRALSRSLPQRSGPSLLLSSPPADCAGLFRQ
jgi:hypothetical protein